MRIFVIRERFEEFIGVTGTVRSAQTGDGRRKELFRFGSFLTRFRSIGYFRREGLIRAILQTIVPALAGLERVDRRSEHRNAGLDGKRMA